MTDLERLAALRLQIKMGVVLSGESNRTLLAMVDRLLAAGKQLEPQCRDEHLLKGWQAYLPPPEEADPFERAKEKVEAKAAKAGATLFGDE
jgi:hypothetical protein